MALKGMADGAKRTGAVRESVLSVRLIRGCQRHFSGQWRPLLVPFVHVFEQASPGKGFFALCLDDGSKRKGAIAVVVQGKNLSGFDVWKYHPFFTVSFHGFHSGTLPHLAAELKLQKARNDGGGWSWA